MVSSNTVIKRNDKTRTLRLITEQDEKAADRIPLP